MLDTTCIRAITLDLDDTLWPVWPTIHRAEAALQAWMETHAPATARHWGQEHVRRALRASVERDHAHMLHDLSHLRRECIRLAVQQAGDDPALVDPAFELFFEHRQRVDLFADALPALRRLSAHYPVLTLSNGNADVVRVGISEHFRAQVTARETGVSKPHRRIFDRAAALAQVAPHEVLHIGDDPALDVIGALDAGMQTVWVNREGRDWPYPDRLPHLQVSDLHTVCLTLGVH